MQLFPPGRLCRLVVLLLSLQQTKQKAYRQTVTERQTLPNLRRNWNAKFEYSLASTNTNTKNAINILGIHLVVIVCLRLRSIELFHQQHNEWIFGWVLVFFSSSSPFSHFACIFSVYLKKKKQQNVYKFYRLNPTFHQMYSLLCTIWRKKCNRYKSEHCLVIFIYFGDACIRSHCNDFERKREGDKAHKMNKKKNQ